MKKVIRIFEYIFVSIIALFLGINVCVAQEQQIRLISDKVDPAIGSEFSVKVQYNCSDNTVTALGVSIHFDSTIIKYKGSSDTYDNGKLAAPQVQNDKNNLDGDNSTDKMILLSYSDPIQGNCPGVNLPINLATLKFFKISPEPTSINVNKITGAAGFDFVGEKLQFWNYLWIFKSY